jgi:two-component system chemotaxis response regulator CheB
MEAQSPSGDAESARAAPDEPDKPPCVIALGASLGGIDLLQRLLAHFDASLPAAVLIVLHVSPNRRSHLSQILEATSVLPVTQAIQGERLQTGHVYVAPPDYHMLVRDGRIELDRGARENRMRPAIDPLFRTAARAYGRNLAAVVLSGMQGDGTVGLMAVKAQGGLTIVQDPEESLYRSMPDRAIRYADIDHVAPLREIAALLIAFAHERAASAQQSTGQGAGAPDPHAERTHADMREQTEGKRTGEVSVYACPDCGGALWELDDGGALSYACHVGHAYSPETLLLLKSEAVETALWSAVRTMVERVTIVRQLARRLRESGTEDEATLLEEQANAEEHDIRIIRNFIVQAAPDPGTAVDLEPGAASSAAALRAGRGLK